jgi:phosphoribosylformylglycinamidine cyclo-ligase
MSHVTGGGIAQNLQRVIPPGLSVSVDRSTWRPPEIMHFLASAGSLALADVEDTWNMGVGFFLIVDPARTSQITRALSAEGTDWWPVGTVVALDQREEKSPDWVSGAKGVEGGAVRLIGDYSSSSSS